MSLTNEIVLRPRFKFEVTTNNETLLKGFEDSKLNQNNFTALFYLFNLAISKKRDNILLIF